ncbi:hypothetical protein CS022_16880 [Veronia nyctiphanis]|uniref:Uncharacterized protein n=1 Tax=Veronia nyctiphanis TaxID=1278244 RepID=A0A4Q0YQC7_9GAMM|nr:hypothetical protein [Veronia nyctiphanis]RXJ72224.1 hypothetical protein CS022_16880 [Veronia nyctiphanis]
MWDVVSLMLAIGVMMLIINYWMDPRQIIDDIRTLKGSNDRVEKLERRIEELEKILMSERKSD